MPDTGLNYRQLVQDLLLGEQYHACLPDGEVLPRGLYYRNGRVMSATIMHGAMIFLRHWLWEE